MSGGPPHHPHSRQPPSANTAWNHLQVPNYFPSRQPQHAHMSNEHPILHQPTWHTPTTEPLKTIHPQLLNLEKMVSDRQYARHAPGVDLTLTRNGNSQNGDIPTTPISLSVRDANKINSLPASALEIQAVELTKCSKSISPGLKSISPGLKSLSPGLMEMQGSPKSTSAKRSNKRVDSILERLNPTPDKTAVTSDIITEKPSQSQSVIVQVASSSHDENSNSSSTLNVPTPTNAREDDEVVSPFSNEDSLDSSKSRRKRKPSKTVRVTKDCEKGPENDGSVKMHAVVSQFVPVLLEKEAESRIPAAAASNENQADVKVEDGKRIPERRRSSDGPPAGANSPRKTRRKTSSESETIANIAAMVQQSLKPDEGRVEVKEEVEKPVSVVCAVNTAKENSMPEDSSCSEKSANAEGAPAQAKSHSFVEVENKLEEMFAGIEDGSGDSLMNDKIELVDSKIELEDSKIDESLLKLDSSASTSRCQDKVTSTTAGASNDLAADKSTPKKLKNKGVKSNSRRSSESNDSPAKKKKLGKKSKASMKAAAGKCGIKNKNKKSLNGKQMNSKIEAIKDVYAYDSGSNASSSRSKGPFIQILGPRDSPLSVSVVNAPLNEDDAERKANKSKKFHDDSEYRHKVRSKGLHCSTLSNKYDAQTRDVSWICAFCKKGPHTADPAALIAPGDLFGPYIITTQCPEYERRLDDPCDRQFKSKKASGVLEMNASLKVVGKKSKRKHSESFDKRPSLDSSDCTENYLGMVATGNNSYEIWVHEDCIVWSPGIYLIGPKIVGLEEAIWTSCNVTCSKCHLKGANVCCLKRGCPNIMHYDCSRISGWQLDDETYKAYCAAHRK